MVAGVSWISNAKSIGTAPSSPQTLPSLGASILTPLALSVPVPFYLRLEHCSLDRRIVRSSFVFPFRVNAI